MNGSAGGAAPIFGLERSSRAGALWRREITAGVLTQFLGINGHPGRIPRILGKGRGIALRPVYAQVKYIETVVIAQTSCNCFGSTDSAVSISA
jgi:hypothetical protein